MILYLTCLVMFLGGQGIQLFWVKIPSLKGRSTDANYKFSFKEYWEADYHLIVGTFILVAVALIGLDEIVYLRPSVMEYLKWGFFFLGYSAQSVVLAKLSKFETKLSNIIDTKTNIADNK